MEPIPEVRGRAALRQPVDDFNRLPFSDWPYPIARAKRGDESARSGDLVLWQFAVNRSEGRRRHWRQRTIFPRSLEL